MESKFFGMRIQRMAKKAAILGLASLIGTTAGFSLSSLIREPSDPEFRASISGIFLTELESQAIAEQYLALTSHWNSIVLRAPSEPRSPNRSAELAEIFSLRNLETVDDANMSFRDKAGLEMVRVKRTDALDFLSIEAWGKSKSDVVAISQKALRAVNEIDRELFPNSASPITVVFESTREPAHSTSSKEVDWLLVEWLAWEYLAGQQTASLSSRQKDSLLTVLESGPPDGENDLLRGFRKEVSFQGNRYWNISAEGNDFEVVSNGAAQVSEFLSDFDSKFLEEAGFNGAILVLGLTEAVPSQLATSFNPRITSTVSGFLCGLALGILWLAFMGHRTPQKLSSALSQAELEQEPRLRGKT